MIKFSRRIKFSYPTLDYLKNKDNTEFKLKKYLYNCHFGSLKLTYSEIEFLSYCSKYIDINKCLIVYIGAQPGFRLKKIFIDLLFPNLKFLLYDPMPFDIEEDKNFIIKTDKDGWFDDNKIEQVLKIANGRKILYISDIRLSDENFYIKENIIYKDMIKQQNWGIMMKAEFMLLKFRMFFYEKSIDEINFINNNFIINDLKKYNLFYNINNKKQSSINKYLLYLNGKIYSQIYQGPISTETRLLVKKIKYYKNKDNYESKFQDGYKMRYYNNLKYEQILNYFNNTIRIEEYVYKKSYKLEKYLPNYYINYTSASEYYIIYNYFKYYKKENSITIKKIINIIAIILIILSSKYNNNIIKCIYKNIKLLKNVNNNIIKQFNINKVFKRLQFLVHLDLLLILDNQPHHLYKLKLV